MLPSLSIRDAPPIARYVPSASRVKVNARRPTDMDGPSWNDPVEGSQISVVASLLSTYVAVRSGLPPTTITWPSASRAAWCPLRTVAIVAGSLEGPDPGSQTSADPSGPNHASLRVRSPVSPPAIITRPSGSNVADRPPER